MRVSIKRAAPDQAALTNMGDDELLQLMETRRGDRAWSTLCALVLQLRDRVSVLEGKRK